MVVLRGKRPTKVNYGGKILFETSFDGHWHGNGCGKKNTTTFSLVKYLFFVTYKLKDIPTHLFNLVISLSSTSSYTNCHTAQFLMTTFNVWKLW